MVKLDNIIHVHAERKIYSLFDYFKVEMQRINTLKLDVTYGGGGRFICYQTQYSSFTLIRCYVNYLIMIVDWLVFSVISAIFQPFNSCSIYEWKNPNQILLNMNDLQNISFLYLMNLLFKLSCATSLKDSYPSKNPRGNNCSSVSFSWWWEVYYWPCNFNESCLTFI